MKVKTALTIGGSDPSGAAGIQADLKVFSACGVYGMSVITALTSQNSREVQRVTRVPACEVESQFRSVFEDIRIDALKIGMLASEENLETVSRLLKESKQENVIFDPVLVSSSGTPLIERGAIEKMKERLLPLVDLITPNLDEAEALTGRKLENTDNMKEAARAIHNMGACSVLVKGGHLPGRAIDIFYDGADFETLDIPKVTEKEFRGTGCALSAAITARLAGGDTMKSAVIKAKGYVTESIKEGYEELGKGMGILNHNQHCE